MTHDFGVTWLPVPAALVRDLGVDAVLVQCAELARDRLAEVGVRLTLLGASLSPCRIVEGPDGGPVYIPCDPDVADVFIHRSRWRRESRGMTLGEATDFLALVRPTLACACAGPTPPDSLCPCHRSRADATTLRRAASVVAGLVRDVARGD